MRRAADRTGEPATPSFAIGDDTAGESVSGAVYTSTETRDIVNANQYDTKPEVYFNGGPSDPDNPKDAALLHPPEPYSGVSWYWIYQVTSPNGAALLSEDPWYCRVVEVRNGRFYRVPTTAEVVSYFGLTPSAVTVWSLGGSGGNKWQYTTVADGGDCSHHFGGPFSAGDAEENVSVQLYPYQDTPNNGGVYKAWATPGVDFQCIGYLPTIADFDGRSVGSAGYPNGEDCAGNHGFVNAQSKTDNYKVDEDVQKYPAEITVKKFHDKDLDGIKDAGEEWVTGWQVDITDPFASQQTEYTQFTYFAAVAGTYTFLEETPSGTVQTVAYLDAVQQSLYPTANPSVAVTVDGPKPESQKETHEIVYGNVGIGSATACKIYDVNGDGMTDAEDTPIAGWKFVLTGTDVLGNAVGPSAKFTGSNGCVSWNNLLPGSYRITEVLPPSPPDYYASGGVTYQDFQIVSQLSGAVISGFTVTKTFYNYCTGTADFGTKGYWHNKNGLSELEWEFIDGYVNTLDPYDSETTYFGACDEPFDGHFTAGGDCPGSMDASEGTIWAAGTWQAEISKFLVDPVGDGGQCEQLAEQLLAFIFNVEYRLGGGGAIETSPGVFTPTATIIGNAITAWQSGDDATCQPVQEFIEGFNSSDAVAYISGSACPFSYPD